MGGRAEVKVVEILIALLLAAGGKNESLKEVVNDFQTEIAGEAERNDW